MKEVHLDESRIQWHQKAVDWKDAIKSSAAPLLNDGDIQETYVEAMIRNIEELGPYILIAPDVALPHARPEHGVEKAGYTVTVFKEPVLFPKGTDQSVREARVFVCLAAVDSESHLGLLQQISGLIEDRSLIEALLQASSEADVHKALSGWNQ